MDKKRIIFIALFVVVSIGLGYLLYRIFFASSTPTTPDITPITVGPDGTPIFPIAGETFDDEGNVITTQPDTLPTGRDTELPSNLQTGSAAPQITQPIDAAISGVHLSGSNVQFYNREDGLFYARDTQGNIKQLSDQVFFDVQDVTWSSKNNTAVLEYPDGANIVYDFNTKKQVTLPKHWEDFSFSESGDKIAAKSLGLATENKWLVYTSADGSQVNSIEPLGDNESKVIVDWSPNQQIVAFSRTGQALGADREEILFVGLNGENYRSMIVEGRGFETQWSPTGKNLLYSVYSARSDYKPELWIVGATPQTIGENRRLIGLNTWPDKCSFGSERFLYCAVPREMGIGAGMAKSITENTPDRLMQIDIQTGLKKNIPLDDVYLIKDIFVDEETNILYFTDAYTDGLSQIAL
ncbi:MAG: hypothetical protein HOE80_03075 [Candidatus Magasanikbacteria bacterium]|nr:hypothetical protein [Candidatus Magasanikbacteria bacterium]